MSKTSNTKLGGKKQSRLATIFVFIAVIILGLSINAWWHTVRSNPERTLMGAIENSFRTKSLVREVSQDSTPQIIEQKVALDVSPSATAQSLTTIKQTGSVEASVQTETISSKDGEFVRYTDIQTSQQNSEGKALNFDDVLNIWGRTTTEETGQPGQVYGEAVLGVVPTGNFSAAARKQLMNIVVSENVYSYDEKTLVRTTKDGRPMYSYDVKVDPTAYIKLLKAYGSLADMPQLEQLDPSQYANAEPLVFRLSVDVWSQRITEIEYTGGARKENMSSFGVSREIETPKDSISVLELQSKVQQAQE